MDPAELEKSIRDAGRAGKYAQAKELTGALLSARRHDRRTKPYQVVDAEWLVRTTEQAALLEDSAQAELSWAERADAQLEEIIGRGLYEESSCIVERQLEIRKRLLGQEHPDSIMSVSNFAFLLQQKGNYAEAERLFREVLALRRRLLGDEHPQVADGLNNLAVLLHDRGEYAEAEPLMREALAISRVVLGHEHVDVIRGLNNLAALLVRKGDYFSAEALHREALAMGRRLRGPEHRDVQHSLNNLGIVLLRKGDIAGAEPFLEEALAMARTLFGDEHPVVAASLHNLALVFREKGDFAKAVPVVREALAMRRKLCGEHHPEVARSLDLLAILLWKNKDRAQAIQLERESLILRQRVFGREHPEVSWSLFNLGWMVGWEGDSLEAESLCREALALDRKLLGAEHPRVAAILRHLALLAWSRNAHMDAADLLSEAARVYDAARLRVGIGSERATFERSPYRLLAAAQLVLGKPLDAWSATEKDSGRVLAELLFMAERRCLSLEEATRQDMLKKELATHEKELETLRRAAREANAPNAIRKIESTRDRLLAAEAAWGTFQRGVADRYPVAEGQSYPLNLIQSALMPDQAIIGWLDPGYAIDTPFAGWRPMSWGYVIRREGSVLWERLREAIDGAQSALKSPPFPSLSCEGSLRSAARSYRRAIEHRPVVSGAALQRGQTLWVERIQPLTRHLEGIRELIVLPSGPMLGVPVEALPVDDHGSFLGDRFIVSYAPSATIFAWLTARAKVGGREHFAPCLAVGDPLFRTDDLEDVEAVQETASASLRRSALAGNPQALSRLKRLPSTRDEALWVARLHGQGSRALVGEGATEQALVRMAEQGELRQFGTIHIATHALVDDERPERSALVLSQVDLPDSLEAVIGGRRVYRGVITARDIVREWKLDADLVTLSACETGLGTEVAGEGYIGLGHAFLQAGARSLLVSLWKVEDRATSMLMQRFYRNRLGRSDVIQGLDVDQRPPKRAVMTKAEALAEAKRWLREWRDADGARPFAHPFFWAGFILIGERN